jgi:hypothetical protein
MFFSTCRKSADEFIFFIEKLHPIELKALPHRPYSQSPSHIFKLSD